MDPVRKLAGVQESSGPLLANAYDPIRIGREKQWTREVFLIQKILPAAAESA